MLKLTVKELKDIIYEDHADWESVEEVFHPPKYDTTLIDVIFTKREDTYRRLEDLTGPFYLISYTRYGTSSSGYIRTLEGVRFDRAEPSDPQWNKLVECPEVHRVAVTTYKWEAIK